MAVINGSDLLLYIDSTAIGLATSATLNDSTDTIDVTTKSNTGYADFIGGLQSATIDFEGLADFTTEAAVFTALKNETEVDWVLSDTSATTGNRYSGSGLITDLTITWGMEEAATYSGTITVITAITQTAAT